MRELLLISQDTTFFGIDRGERGALARLLRRLNDVEGLAWIRLLYLYPTTITDDVLDAMAECEKVCKYIDLPLQHASADVLRRMRRPGNREAYDKLLARIRARVPGVTLRTTFIVGFPGETEQDFEALCDFVRDTELRPRRRLHLLARGRHARVRAGRRRAGGGQGRAPERADGAAAADRGAPASRRASASDVRVMVDGPSPESRLVLTGRLEGQAPGHRRDGVPRRVRPVGASRPGELVTAPRDRRARLRSRRVSRAGALSRACSVAASGAHCAHAPMLSASGALGKVGPLHRLHCFWKASDVGQPAPCPEQRSERWTGGSELTAHA